MSGLCGFASDRQRAGAPEMAVRAMTSTLRHRGPDGTRHWIHSTLDAAIGHVYLKSFEASGNGTPPALVETDRTVAAVDGPVIAASAHHGENPNALAALRAFESGGVDRLSTLSGPHNLALWDKQSRTLYISRDRLGERPLYYHYSPQTNTLVFGSEIKALLAHPAVTPQADLVGLGLFLTFGWIPAPKTVFLGIQKLFPGELLSWSPACGLKQRRYWRLPPLDPHMRESSASFVAEAKRLFLRALEKNLSGLNEVGVFLSGGMDSTILVIALKELGISRIHTFTLDVPGDPHHPRESDVPYARIVANAFGTTHHELVLGNDFDPTLLLPRLMAQFDDPIMTPNCYTKYLLGEMARRAGINSLLTGSGAGGGCGPYRRFRDPKLRQKLQKKVDGIEDAAERFIRLRAKLIDFNDLHALLGEAGAIGPGAVARFLDPYLDEIRTDDVPRAYLLANLLTTCPEKMCMVLDRGGKLASVDIRSPHLDQDLVEFQMTVPSSFDGGRSFVGIKCLLKQAYAPLIPEPVLQREEAGFPCYYWHRGELRALQDRLLSRDHLQRAGMFRPEAVCRIVEQERHDTESKSAGKRAWALTQLSLWHAIHVAKSPEWLEAAGSPAAG